MQFASVFLRKLGNKSLNYIKSTYISYWLVTILTTAYGLILVMSATRNATSGPRQVQMQILAIVIGYAGAFILSNVDYERLGELWLIFGGVPFLFECSTLIWGHGADAAADDTAWIRLPIINVNFQPSELLKIGFLITISYHLSRVIRAKKLDNPLQLILLCIHGAVPVLLINETGDQGSAVVFLIAFIIIMFGVGVKWYYLLLGSGLFAAVLPLMWKYLFKDFQKERITSVYNPKPGDELGILYQQTLSKMAIGSGEVTGRGLFQGPMVASGRNSADHNDFIFSVVGEELGFIGSIMLIACLLTIMIMTLYAGTKAHDEMGRIICLGYFAFIATQSILNIGMCIGVLPVIGITLPFFSAGGSSSMCMYFGIGLVISVYMRRKEANIKLMI